MSKLNTSTGKYTLTWRCALWCVATMLITCSALAQENTITLYVSAQSKQATTFSGHYNAQTDSFTFGHITITAAGPIMYTTDKDILDAPRNQDVSWGGKVTVNMNAIPTPGTTESASLHGTYAVGYARPYGAGSEGNVMSTYYCNGQCAHHNGIKGIHEIVNDSGVQNLDFKVVSIMTDLPDTLNIATSQVSGSSIAQLVTANCYPATGGKLKWWCDDPAVKLTEAHDHSVNVALRTAINSNPILHVTFEIAGITYTTQTVLKSGDCSCSSYNKLLVIDKLSVNMNDDRHKNITTSDPANCTYSVQAPAFSMNMNGAINRQLAVNTGNTTIKFKKECNNTYKNIDLNWEGNTPLTGIKIGNIENAIQLTATRTHLYTANNGTLSGEVTIHAVIKDLDVLGNGAVIIKKTEGDIIYDVNKGYDFSGLKDITINMVKKGSGNEDVVIGSYHGNMSSNGNFAGVITATSAPFISNSFALTINELKQDFVLHAATGVYTQGKASGNVTVTGIQGLAGNANFHFDINEGGGITTRSTSGEFTAFGMKLSALDIKADLNRNFDLFSIAGKATAKHAEFNAPLAVEYLRADNGALTSFSTSGKAVYHGFSFYFLKSVFSKAEGALNLTTSMELNLAEVGKSEKVSVSKFIVSNIGKISIGSIQGSINHIPAQVDFTANYADNGFSGDFHGTYGNLPVNGTIQIHAKENFDYAQLVLNSQQRMPLGTSGLFLSNMSGAIGLNYEITNPDNSGTPQQGKYQLALKTTVQDEAGLLTATGSGILPFDIDPILGIKGMITMPKTAVFNGNVNMDYHLNQQSLEGNIATNISLGQSSNFLNSGNCNVHFTIGNERWTAASSEMSGKIFNDKLVLENSAIDMNGTLAQPKMLNGNIRGTLKGEYQYPVSFPTNDGKGGTVTGTIIFIVNTPINAPINQDGLIGSINAILSGNDELTLDIPSIGYHQIYQSTVTASGQIANNNGNITFQGTMDIVFGKYKYKKPLNISF